MSLRYLLLLKIINNPKQKVMPAWGFLMWDGEILQTSPKEALFPHSLTQNGTSLQSSPSPSQTNNEWMLAILGQKAYRTFQYFIVKNYLKSAVVSVVSTFARRLMKRNCEMRKRGRRQTLQSRLGWEEGSLWTKNKTFFNSHSILRQNASSHNIFLYFYAQHM